MANVNTRIILAPATGAGQSQQFECDGVRPVTVELHAASGLTAAEYADIQTTKDNGTSWQDLYYDGSQIRLTNTSTSVTVYGPGIYRVDKEATTNAAGIYLHEFKAL